MLLCSLQVVAVACVLVCLGRWRLEVKRRRGQSWESLIARLQHGCNARELSEHFLRKEGLSSTPDETWERIKGPAGLWIIHHNAGIMMEMAEFATRHGHVDIALLETLRSDATQVRMCVLRVLVQNAVNRTSEGVRMKAFQAASMYSGMAARMMQLMRDNAAGALPEFVAAM